MLTEPPYVDGPIQLPEPAPRGAYVVTTGGPDDPGDAWLEARGWSARPLVLVQPGNRRTMRGRRLRLSAADDKAWPLERWGELLHRLQVHTVLRQGRGAASLRCKSSDAEKEI